MVAGDFYDGLARAAELFVRWPVKRCVAGTFLMLRVNGWNFLQLLLAAKWGSILCVFTL
jgi:hypothetical protein